VEHQVAIKFLRYGGEEPAFVDRSAWTTTACSERIVAALAQVTDFREHALLARV
jgi:hypothetical protein